MIKKYLLKIKGFNFTKYFLKNSKMKLPWSDDELRKAKSYTRRFFEFENKTKN